MQFFENVSGSDTSKFGEIICDFFCLDEADLSVEATNKTVEKFRWFIDDNGVPLPEDLSFTELIVRTKYLICATGIKSKKTTSLNSNLYIVLYPAQYPVDESCALYNYFINPQLVPEKFLADKTKNRMGKALPKETISIIKATSTEVLAYFKAIIKESDNIVKDIIKKNEETKIEAMNNISASTMEQKQNIAKAESTNSIKMEITREDSVQETLAFERSQFTYIASSISLSALTILYSHIHNKESWSRNNFSDLARYIAGLKIKARAEYEITKTSGSGYIVTPDGKEAVINTGLMDDFANDILIVDGQFEDPNSMFMFVVPECGLIATQSFKNADVPGILQFAPVQDLVFNASDLKDTNLAFNISHILQTRRDRFPEAVKSLPTMVMLSLFESALKRALNIQRRDYKYFLPMYNFSLKQIDFLVPLYLMEDITGVPEIVGILSKQDEKYILRTIISTEIAYANARLIAPLEASWLARESK